MSCVRRLLFLSVSYAVATRAVLICMATSIFGRATSFNVAHAVRAKHHWKEVCVCVWKCIMHKKEREREYSPHSLIRFHFGLVSCHWLSLLSHPCNEPHAKSLTGRSLVASPPYSFCIATNGHIHNCLITIALWTLIGHWLPLCSVTNCCLPTNMHSLTLIVFTSNSYTILH